MSSPLPATPIDDRPLADALKERIRTLVFPGSDARAIQSYFYFYSQQCKTILTHASHDANYQSFPLRTHSDAFNLLVDILEGVTYSGIKERLRERSRSGDNLPTEAQLDLSLSLGLQLLTMLEPKLPATYTGREHITWTEGTIFDIKETASLFLGQPRLPVENLRLDAYHFNARSLERISNFTVYLTANLADHLWLDEVNDRVYIFHYTSFLKACETQPTMVFPDGFIEETLQTIALMLPSKSAGRSSRSLERWYKTKARDNERDFSALQIVLHRRRLEEYRYWRDRLATLKEAYDDSNSRPSRLRRMWYDRRAGTHWHAMWAAIMLTSFFGLIQSLMEILQVYKAYRG